MGRILYLTFRDILGLESSYRSGSRQQVLSRGSIIFHDNYVRGIIVFSDNTGLTPSDRGEEVPFSVGGRADTTEGGEIASAGNKDLSEFMRKFLLTLGLHKFSPIYSSSNFWLRF